MPTMRAVQVPGAKQPLQTVQREVPAPGPGQVRVRVEACGVCHSDVLTKEGLFPGIEYPRVPGHEIAGVVDAIGADVPLWKPGDRAGIGWHGGHCGYCDSCRRGDYLTCRNGLKVTGIAFDGGYADYVVAPWAVLARIPDGLTAAEAAPLMVRGRHDLQSPPQLRSACRATSSPSSASAASGTSACSSPRRWASTPSRSPAAPTRRPSRRSSARASTSTARHRTRPRSSRSSAARA